MRSPWLLGCNCQPHGDFFCGALGQAALSLAVKPSTLCNTPQYNSHPSSHLEDLFKPTQREAAGATNTSSPHLHPKQCLHYPRLSFPSLLQFFLISSHLPEEGLAEASLRADNQSMAAGNAFNSCVMLAQVCQVLS